MRDRLADVVFWGKFDETSGALLPLPAHCIDVALVFRALVEIPGILRSLEAAAGETLDEQRLDRLAVLAALHDAGKANLGFQARILPRARERAGHVRELLVLFDSPELQESFAWAIDYETLGTWADGSVLEGFLLASWSHHGFPQRPDSVHGAEGLRFRRYWSPTDGVDPFDGIRQVGDWCRLAFPAAFERGDSLLPARPRLQHRFAGLVMLADWIGSDARVFPVRSCTATERIATDHLRIPPLLRRIGLDPAACASWAASRIPPSFAERFGFPPRPLQELVGKLDPADDTTRLLVLEAETGSGKTEAAVHWFLTLFGSGLVDSLYFALPTRVAARELYGRVRHVIESLFPDAEARPPVLLAVPGYAQIDGRVLDIALSQHAAEEPWAVDGLPAPAASLRYWAAERPKRFLAATVAVGTIDQALLSMVQARHAHLRSVCLDRALLVVDEVHASDRYSRRILEDLLSHHLRCGGRALLLSATLGTEARVSLLSRAPTGCSPAAPCFAEATGSPYPALSTADGRIIPCGRSTGDRRIEILLQPLAADPSSILPRVREALGAGARVLVVLNTVDRAIDFFRAAETDLDRRFLFSVSGQPCPHHGRFAPSDRVLLDSHVSRALGKGSPSRPILLVGTQTLEQSLDIDADLLVTDLCPADVLLQRLGRLHRHRRSRPPGFETPRCIVLVPDVSSLEEILREDGAATRRWKGAGYGSVYEDIRVLELTWRYLRRHAALEIPRQNRDFVESTVHSESLGSLVGTRWDRHARSIEGTLLAGTVAAATVSLAPLLDTPFADLAFNDLGQAVSTRLGVASWQVPLPSPWPGPFGAPVDEVIVPGHYLPSPPGGVTVSDLGGVPGFRLEAHLHDGSSARFTYTRYGLRRDTGDSP